MRTRPFDNFCIILIVLFTAAMLTVMTFAVIKPHKQVCHLHNLIRLTATDGHSISFTAPQITVVMPNSHGIFQAPAKTIISTADSHEYGVRETVDEVRRILSQAECQL